MLQCSLTWKQWAKAQPVRLSIDTDSKACCPLCFCTTPKALPPWNYWRRQEKAAATYMAGVRQRFPGSVRADRGVGACLTGAHTLQMRPEIRSAASISIPEPIIREPVVCFLTGRTLHAHACKPGCLCRTGGGEYCEDLWQTLLYKVLARLCSQTSEQPHVASRALLVKVSKTILCLKNTE